MKICPESNCTGCGVCAYICPQKCINMQENEIGLIYPRVDEECCVRCGACTRVCPQVSPVVLNKPQKAYAAWSMDPEERRTSASGGIAAEIYQYALSQGCKVGGAKSNEDFSVSMDLVSNQNETVAFKNSKYVFSNAVELYPKIKEALRSNESVVVIGLPCQIAAIKNVFHEKENLILIDVVCHGVTPFAYLKQHIKYLEKKCGQSAERMSFRDPEIGTNKYNFTLYNKDNECFYAKRTKDGDTYQYGYHRMVSYRENCYHCLYAQENRCSDITLSDYKGLGKLVPCDFDETKVSSILIHTKKGEDIIQELIKQNAIFAQERPVQEPIQGDAQLQHPSLKSKARLGFESQIVRFKGNFEYTMGFVMAREEVRKLFFRAKQRIKRLLVKRGK